MHPTQLATSTDQSEQDNATLMSRTQSEQSIDDSNSDASDPESCDTAATPLDETFPSNATDPPTDSKTTLPEPPPATTSPNTEEKILAISELFKPKIKLLKMLLQIDFFAG